MSDGLSNVGIACWRSVDKAAFKAWANRRHKIHGVGTAEAAMHALALLQDRIGDVDGAHYRPLALGRVGAEIDYNRRSGCARHAVQIDRRKRQRAWETPDFTVDKQPADIVLSQESVDHLTREAGIFTRNINEVRPAVGGDHNIGLFGIAADKSIASAGVVSRFNHLVLVVGIVERRVERFSKVDRNETRR